MAIFRKSENTEPDIVAVFDIGSGTVSGALVEIIKGKKPVILFSTAEEIISQADMSFGDLFGATEKTIYNVGQQLLLEKRGAPKRVYCFLASPWYAGQTRVIKITKQKEFVFTKKIWQELLDKEIKRFIDETISQDADAIVMEKKNMSVKLNGYTTMNPLDQKTRTVELAVFFSIGSGNVIRAFQAAVERSFSVPVEFSSFMFPSFIITRDIFHEKPSSSLVIDIGSKITEIGYIQNDVLMSIASFPIGVKQIEHALMETFSLSLSETQSLLQLYISGKLESNRARKVQIIVSKEIDAWYTMYTQTLSSIHIDTQPNTAYILINENIGSLFAFDSRMKIVDDVILPVHIVDGKTFASYAHVIDIMYRNPFIVLESLFITRMYSH